MEWLSRAGEQKRVATARAAAAAGVSGNMGSRLPESPSRHERPFAGTPLTAPGTARPVLGA
ncbi:hypothetical protein GCM10009530_29120 [Microbispora corallina]|uniref:Uncharacterized protein n=1 Tax=Microbispora corallina TaxID=83302 RepID=A0ABQ4FZS8_9ACTN|nr:hypothetical protein Mco01_32970 [Microbispora corallina]